MNCPLCHSSNVSMVEKISVTDLVEIYKNGRLPPLNLDVTDEFNDLAEMSFCNCLDCDLRFFDPIVTGSEQFYEQLQEFEWYYQDEKDEYTYAKKFIDRSNAILEIGSGKGAFAKIISSNNYTGLEFSQKAIENAALEGVRVLNQSIQQHARDHSDQYEVVLGFQVLEHVGDLHSFVASSVACLKPDGLLLFSVPSADSFVSMVTNNATNMPPHHLSWWSDDSLRSIARIFGLELVDIHHEKLINKYGPVYSYSVILLSVKKMLGDEVKLVDLSVKHKILEKLARLSGRFLSQGLLDPRVLPNGHSVNVIYRKPKNSQ